MRKKSSMQPGFMTAAFLLLLAGPVRGAVVIERVVAVVEKDVVLLTELNERLRPYLPQLSKITNPTARMRAFHRLQRQELNRIIEEQLILREASERKLTVSSVEINRAIQSVMEQNKVTYKELIDALKAQGYTVERYREEMRRQILRLKTINIAVRSRITISEDDVRAYYEKQKRKLGVQQKVNAQIILFSVPVDAKERKVLMARARAKAARALAEIRSGKAGFGELAKKLSDHASRSEGGRLGFVTNGQLPVALEPLLFAAKTAKGALVGPVDSDDGVYIAKMLGRKESEALPFEKVRSSLKQQLFNERLMLQTYRWLKELRSKAYIDIRL